VDDLLARLEEPKVVGALNNLLDHAELLSVLLIGLDGFVSRGDVIADSLADAVGELRGASGVAGPLASIDVRGLAGSAATLSSSVITGTPALSTLLSTITDPRTVEGVTQLAGALAEGRTKAEAEPMAPTGVFGLLRALKDEDTARGLGFLIQVSKALGRQLSSH
jgi:hypothetical protein